MLLSMGSTCLVEERIIYPRASSLRRPCYCSELNIVAVLVVCERR
jgi:hypothetical protein